MISWIVLAVSALIGFWFGYHEDQDIGFGLLGAFIAIFLLGGPQCLGLYFPAHENGNLEWFEAYSAEMKSFEREAEVQGKFILGCGGIGSWEYYKAYVRQDDGNYALKEFPISDTELCEKDIDTAVLHVYKPRFKSHFLTFGDPTGERYVIDLPRGSIVQRYEP